MPSLIVFDLDGTLVNAYPAVVKSVNFTLKQLGFPLRSPAVIKRAVGWGDRQLMAYFVGDDLADRALRFYRPHHAKALTKDVKLLPTVKSTLGFLSAQGHILAIATNRPDRFTRIILKELRIKDFFRRVLCADKATRPKPFADMLLAIAREFRVNPRQMYFVGDMTIDIQTGKNAGAKTIAVTSGSSSIAELKALKPDRIIAKMNELKTIIE